MEGERAGLSRVNRLSVVLESERRMKSPERFSRVSQPLTAGAADPVEYCDDLLCCSLLRRLPTAALAPTAMLVVCVNGTILYFYLHLCDLYLYVLCSNSFLNPPKQLYTTCIPYNYDTNLTVNGRDFLGLSFDFTPHLDSTELTIISLLNSFLFE